MYFKVYFRLQRSSLGPHASCCDKIALPHLNTPMSKACGSASQAQCPLMTLRAPRDVSMGVVRETALASSTIFAF